MTKKEVQHQVSVDNLYTRIFILDKFKNRAELVENYMYNLGVKHLNPLEKERLMEI